MEHRYFNCLAKTFGILPKIVTVMLFLGSSIALAGGESSGGGSICYQKDHPAKLLDLAVNSDLAPMPATRQTFNLPLSLGQIGLKLGYEKIQVQSLHAYNTLVGRLNLYQHQYPRMISFIKNAVNSIEFRVTNKQVQEASDSYIDRTSKCDTVIPAVLFTELFGAFTVVARYNELDDLNQAGLILHETLRLIQKVWLSGKRDDQEELNTLELQRIVALVMYQNPKNMSEKDRFLFSNFVGSFGDFKGRVGQYKINIIGFDLCQSDLLRRRNNFKSTELTDFCKKSENRFKTDILLHELRNLSQSEYLSESERNHYYKEYQSVLDILLEVVSTDIHLTSIQLREVFRKNNSQVFNIGEDLIFKRLQGKEDVGFFDFKLKKQIDETIFQIQRILKD